jgi:hypothetical protein
MLLEVIEDFPSATIEAEPSSPHHLGSGDKGYIRFHSKPDLPMAVRLEYVDGMADKDVMTIELRDAHTFEVLGFESDTR